MFEFYAAMERAASAFAPSVAKIQRLGHVVVHCARRDEVLRTLTGELNFKVSDHFADQVAFLRCFPNPYHHSFGVARSDVDGLHHVNFMVTDVDDIGRATDRMRQAGVEVVYGPGRHDISNSIFFYYLDPDGLTVEYSFGMEEFPEEAPREARQLPLNPAILDSWADAGAALRQDRRGRALAALRAARAMETIMTTTEITRSDVEEFLYREAALLDRWQLDDWLALFSDDAIYHVPTVGTAPDVTPDNTLFYVADDRVRLASG